MKLGVIATGGKQYVVQEGDTLMVEKLDAEEGKSVTFDTLFTDDGKEAELAPKDKVQGTVVKSGKKDTVLVVRYKQKSRYLKKRGHRQPYTKVKITNV